MAGLAAPVFGSVIAYDPFVPDENWPADVRRGELAEVLAASNVVSLHTPLNEETRNLLPTRKIIASLQSRQPEPPIAAASPSLARAAG